MPLTTAELRVLLEKLENLLPVEIQEMIWGFHMANDAITVLAKKLKGTPNNIPSLYCNTSAKAYSKKSKAIISSLVLKHAIGYGVWHHDPKLALRANIIDFDFTNLIRFIKFLAASPLGDINHIGTFNNEPHIKCRHKITSSLDSQPSKLTTWINFANSITKKKQIKIGAFHQVLYFNVEESPALWEVSDRLCQFGSSQDNDFSQHWLVAEGIAGWRMSKGQQFLYGNMPPPGE